MPERRQRDLYYKKNILFENPKGQAEAGSKKQAKSNTASLQIPFGLANPQKKKEKKIEQKKLKHWGPSWYIPKSQTIGIPLFQKAPSPGGESPLFVPFYEGIFPVGA
eukprot:FR735499.1.p3 GENE.FR735499.1~~FR735499.1.p3  ORF type:complete len:107 (+),score=36.33 FR735499.1:593-913(+)